MGIKCRVCQTSELKEFLTLGEMPPVNAFLDYKELYKEKKYPLTLAYCPACFLVQLINIVPSSELFSNYLHLSSASASNINHLREVANIIKERFNITNSTRILEIGSNDGTLLAFLKEYSPYVLGVDPAENLLLFSKEKGVETIPAFFNKVTAMEILNTTGKYDIVVAINIVPHTPDVVSLLEGVEMILNDNGIFIMEGVYALETILRGEFDTIYHEHVYTFSLHSLIATFKQANLIVVDVEKIPQQGGSLRVYAKRREDAKSSSIAVNSLLKEEKELGLATPKLYSTLVSKVEQFKKQLKDVVEHEKNLSGKLIGIGAPARGVVILNYCGINQNDIEYIVDDTPLKQGKITPGVHIPVKSWDVLKPEKKQIFLLLSWNYRDHLLARLKPQFCSSKVIIPFPQLEVTYLG